jgi:hypothetical protein
MRWSSARCAPRFGFRDCCRFDREFREWLSRALPGWELFWMGMECMAGLNWIFGLGLAVFGMGAIGLSPAQAQVSITGQGRVSGTVIPPSNNPNFNQNTTRVDTDSQGNYYRNGVLVYSAQNYNPNLVGVTAQGRYYVDFFGIPVVSVNGSLASDLLTGDLVAIKRSHNEPVKFYGTIQDEFVVRGQYAGTVTDPATGNQYQGTFTISGQGPRYSDKNVVNGPTVFDFQSHYNTRATPQIPGKPTVFSYSFADMPVKLTVTVPAGLVPIGAGGVGPTPVVPSTPTPVVPTTQTPVTPTPVTSTPTDLFSRSDRPNLTRVVFQVGQGEAVTSGAVRGDNGEPIGPRSRIMLP